MAVPTKSSNGAGSRPRGAKWSVLLGLLALAALPAAIAATRFSDAYDLLHAGFAIPVAIALGVAAMALARRARERTTRMLAGGASARSARIGRALGLTGILVGVTGAMAIGVFLVLKTVSN